MSVAVSCTGISEAMSKSDFDKSAMLEPGRSDLPARTDLSARAAAVAKPALEGNSTSSMGTPHQINVKDVSDVSEIHQLMVWGSEGSRLGCSHEDFRKLFARKLNSLKDDAATSRRVPGVRSDLCKLSRISSTYHADLKEEALNLLIAILQNDPVQLETAHGILEVIIELNSQLTIRVGQVTSIPFQIKLASAFSAAVQLYIRHYEKNDHVNAVLEEQKKELIDTQNNFKSLNTQENVDLEFASQMAVEASKRLTSDLSLFAFILNALAIAAGAFKKAAEKDLRGFASDMAILYGKLDDKITKAWYDELFVLRDLVSLASDNLRKILIIQTFLANRQEKGDWRFVYGAVELLNKVVIHSKDPELAEIALLGQSRSCKEVKSKGVAGLLEKFDGKGHSGFRKKLVGYCSAYIEIISTTEKGKARIAREKSLLDGLGDKVPTSLKVHLEWVETHFGRNALHEAVIAEDPEAVQTLSGDRVLLNANTKQGNTPLIIAAELGNVKICEILCNAGAETKQLSANGRNVLHAAVRKGKVEVVYLFLGEKKLLNSKDSRGLTPLMTAVQQNNKALCELLLKAAADPEEVDAHGCNVLHHAVMDEKMELVSLFARNPKLINAKDKKGRTPIIIAAQLGLLKVCETLSRLGADLLVCDSNGYNAVYWIASGVVESLAFLATIPKNILNGVSSSGKSALMSAAGKGEMRVCTTLLKAGADASIANAEGFNAQHYAAYEGRVEVIGLLKPFISVSSKSNQGITPLMLAAGRNHLNACRVLLAEVSRGQKENIDVSLVDAKGFNAMHYAAIEGNAEVIAFLKLYILVNSQSNEGFTPLMLAASRNHLTACEALLTDCDPHLLDKRKRTAMDLAVHFENESVVKLLSTLKRTPTRAAEGGHQIELAVVTCSPNGARSESEKKELIARQADSDLEFPSCRNVLDQAIINKIMGLISLHARNSKLINTKDEKVCTLVKMDLLDCDVDGHNAIYWIASRIPESVQFLSTIPKDTLSAVSKNGRSALMSAALEGELVTCARLLASGANPSVVDAKGCSALHYAEDGGKTDIVKFLRLYLSLHSDVDEGVTPLMVAARMWIMRNKHNSLRS